MELSVRIDDYVRRVLKNIILHDATRFKRGKEAHENYLNRLIFEFPDVEEKEDNTLTDE